MSGLQPQELVPEQTTFHLGIVPNLVPTTHLPLTENVTAIFLGPVWARTLFPAPANESKSMGATWARQKFERSRAKGASGFLHGLTRQH
jgi:hypothetical protein